MDQVNQQFITGPSSLQGQYTPLQLPPTSLTLTAGFPVQWQVPTQGQGQIPIQVGPHGDLNGFVNARRCDNIPVVWKYHNEVTAMYNCTAYWPHITARERAWYADLDRILGSGRRSSRSTVVFEALHPAIVQALCKAVEAEIPWHRHLGWHHPARWVLGISKKNMDTILETNGLLGSDALPPHGCAPHDGSAGFEEPPPPAAIAKAILYLKQLGLPASLLGPFQYPLPEAKDFRRRRAPKPKVQETPAETPETPAEPPAKRAKHTAAVSDSDTSDLSSLFLGQVQSGGDLETLTPQVQAQAQAVPVPVPEPETHQEVVPQAVVVEEVLVTEPLRLSAEDVATEPWFDEFINYGDDVVDECLAGVGDLPAEGMENSSAEGMENSSAEGMGQSEVDDLLSLFDWDAARGEGLIQ